MFWLIKFAAAAMMPRHENLLGVRDTGLDGYVRQFMSETNAITRLGVWASSIVFMLTPLITVGLPVPPYFSPAGPRPACESRPPTRSICCDNRVYRED